MELNKIAFLWEKISSSVFGKYLDDKSNLQTGITEGSREAVLQHLTTAYPQLLPSDKDPTLAPPELGIVQL